MDLEKKTKTFAEIYESQGHYKEAISIYIDLLKQDPLDASFIDNIKRLQSLIREEDIGRKKVLEAQIAAFDNLLRKTAVYKAV